MPTDWTAALSDRLPEWHERWVAHAVAGGPMAAADQPVCVDAVNALYRSAGFAPPRRILFVPSSFAALFAGSFAAVAEHLAPGTDAGGEQLVGAAATVEDAAAWLTAGGPEPSVLRARLADQSGDEATGAEDAPAGWAEGLERGVTAWTIENRVRDVEAAATKVEGRFLSRLWDALDHSRWNNAAELLIAGLANAIGEADRPAPEGRRWYRLPGDMAAIAERLGVGAAGLRYARDSSGMWQNMLGELGRDMMLGFAQDIGVAEADAPVFRAWRTLAERSGPRFVHPRFCVIADRPAIIRLDDTLRPDGGTAPFAEWRDGSALYARQGHALPADIVTAAIPVTEELALREEDPDRRYLMRRFLGHDPDA